MIGSRKTHWFFVLVWADSGQTAWGEASIDGPAPRWQYRPWPVALGSPGPACPLQSGIGDPLV